MNLTVRPRVGNLTSGVNVESRPGTSSMSRVSRDGAGMPPVIFHIVKPADEKVRPTILKAYLRVSIIQDEPEVYAALRESRQSPSLLENSQTTQ
jgi:hypothetical protein